MDMEEKGTRMLKRSAIGMLAVHGERYPLVNPIAYQYAGGSVWMTTSRRAAKISLARKDPRAAFLVSGPGGGVLLHGLLEVYDPMSISSQVRAALEAPRFYSSLARYGLKNANYIGGYLLDITRVPAQWWPQNRVVMRLRVSRARMEPMPDWPAGRPAQIASVPGLVRRALDDVSVGILCWGSRGSLMLEPCMWASSEDGETLVAGLGERGLKGPSNSTPGALVVESHHPYRATMMTGVCLRGRIACDEAAVAELQTRYGTDSRRLGSTLRLEPERVTWWRGFQVSSARVNARSTPA
jgi:hypothetical protein